MAEKKPVIVIGGGIAGLTAASLLAHEGLSVTLLESHYQPGGCAGTFKRGPYVFDVGATQIAGLEYAGSHARIFRHLSLQLPSAQILDPACLVDLADGSEPINIWHDPHKWKKERQKQFPNSEHFWSLCKLIHNSNWSFSSRDPVLPIGNTWDLIELFKAIRLPNLATGLLTTLSIADLISICGCSNDYRLRHFLDLQLRLYSQAPANKTAALYGATVLQMAQAPLGLWHLEGSMQVLSNYLSRSFCKNGGKLLLRHRVVRLQIAANQNSWTVHVRGPDGKIMHLDAFDVVCSLPPQSLIELMPLGSGLPQNYLQRIKQLPKPSGAIVFYGVISRIALPENVPLHVQLGVESPGPYFLSISREGDGRAPIGQATLIASAFTVTNDWNFLNEEAYQDKKQIVINKILKTINEYFGFTTADWIHQELATPRSFAYWTGRPEGIVGGLGQLPSNFGLFGLPSRTPMNGLWLCGDSIHPGEGTAGVTQSALMASRQIMARRGLKINLRH